MDTKVCRDCHEVKSLLDFPLNGSGKSRRPVCKPCWSSRNNNVYYSTNPAARNRREERSKLPTGCNSLSAAKTIGETFGRLTVTKFERYANQVPIMSCKCSCGKVVEVRLWDLKSGKTKSCGSHPQFEDRSLPAFRNLYRHTYKKRALNKGLEFDLSEAQFRELTQRECHYCGAMPSNAMGKINSGKTISQYVYNGLDRVDNSKGYTLDNVVTCCSTCNHAKHTMAYEEFTAWIDRLIEFRTRAKSVLVFYQPE